MSLEDLNGHELMKLCKNGNIRAFETIYDRFEKPLLHFAWSFSNDYEIARDAVHQSFEYLLKKADEYEPKASLKSFLYRITKNNCLKHLRKKRRATNVEVDLDSNPDPSLSARTPDRRIEADESVDRILSAIQELDEMYREVIVLRVVEEKKYREIAEILDISIGTVKSRLHKALGQLREKFEPYQPEDFEHEQQ